jgi:ABC transporter DrrB family efflux protein
MGTATSDTAALVGMHMRHLRRSPGKLIGITMNPLVMLLVIGYLFRNLIKMPVHGSYQEYIMGGIAVQVGLASIGPTAIGVAMDLRGGVIDRFRSLPISRTAVLVGHTLSDLIVATISLFIVLTVGYFVGWRIHTGFWPALGALGLLLVFIYAMLWVGVLLGMVIKEIETIESLGAIMVVLFSFLSNAFIAVDILPGWVRPLAEWNPVSSVVIACRRLWGNPLALGSGDFVTRHSSVVALVSLLAIFLIAMPLSVRAYWAIHRRG